MSQIESYRKFLTENLEKSCFSALFWTFVLFSKFYNGGVWTLAGALPIFNRINYRRGCFMKKSFQRVIASPELVSGEAISNHLYVGGNLRPLGLR